MYGFKGFDKNLKCKEFQYKVGKTYKADSISICSKGFHFCKNIDDVSKYYDDEDTRICLVRGIGEFQEEEDKVCFESIEIIRELTKKDIKLTKRNNSGGYRNSGHRNSGYRNSGHYNSGHCNSGHYNSGHYNSGDNNSGDNNSGHYNSGNYNSGNYNSGNYNSGAFNTNEQPLRLFNKETTLLKSSEEWKMICSLNIKPILCWINSDNMTDKEKDNFPSHITTGGFLKNTGKMDFSKLSQDELTLIKSLPNFDSNVFEEISGLTVIVNGEENDEQS